MSSDGSHGMDLSPAGRVSWLLLALSLVITLTSAAERNTTWTVVPPEDLSPGRRFGMAFCTARNTSGLMYAFGGQHQTTMMNDLYSLTYDGVWTRIEYKYTRTTAAGCVIIPRAYATMVSVTDAAFLYGGISQSGYLNDLWSFTYATSTWIIVPIAPACLSSSSGLNRGPPYDGQTLLQYGIQSASLLFWYYDQRLKNALVAFGGYTGLGQPVPGILVFTPALAGGQWDNADLIYSGLAPISPKLTLMPNSSATVCNALRSGICNQMFVVGINASTSQLEVYTATSRVLDPTPPANPNYFDGVFPQANVTFVLANTTTPSPTVTARSFVLSEMINGTFLVGMSGATGEDETLYWFDTTTGEWTAVRVLGVSSRDSGAFVVHPDMRVQIYGGIDNTQDYDDYNFFRLNDTRDCVQESLPSDIGMGRITCTPSTRRPLVEALPTPRRSYAMTSLGALAFVHGGSDVDGMLLNDFWQYDIVRAAWTEREKVNGPSARSCHAMANVGVRIMLYGGATALAISDELWEFNLLTLAWRLISSSSAAFAPPELQRHSLVAFQNSYLVLMGGATAEGSSGRTYVFDVQGAWTLLNTNSDYLLPCALDGAAVALGSTILYGGGVGTARPCRSISRLSIDVSSATLGTGTWALATEAAGGFSDTWGAPVSGGMAVVAPFDRVAAGTAQAIYYPDGTSMLIEGAAQVTAGDRAVSFGARAVTFSGALRNLPAPDVIAIIQTVVTTETLRVGGLSIEFPLCETNDAAPDCVLCGPGTVFNNGTCDPCAKGFYSSTSGADACTPCPTGSFGPFLGATAPTHCVPCPPGTIGATAGLAECVPCAEADRCTRIGAAAEALGASSSSPATRTQLIIAQPHTAVNITASQRQIDDGRIGIHITFGALGSLVVIAFLSSLGAGLTRKWARLDLFFRLHHRVSPRTSPVKAITALGGIMSLLAIVLVLWNGFYVLIPLAFVSETETRGLVSDQLVVDVVFKANLSVSVTALDYPPTDCATPSGGCVAGISVATDSGILLATDADATSITCEYRTGTCTATWATRDATLVLPDTSVAFVFGVSGTSASGFAYHINSTAAYPQQSSSIANVLYASSGHAFRGIAPSTVTCGVTNVLYESLVNASMYTGWLMNYITQCPGQEVTYENYGTTDGVAFTATFQRQTVALTITIDASVTPLLVISAVGGAASFVVGVVAFLMRGIENVLGTRVPSLVANEYPGGDPTVDNSSGDRKNLSLSASDAPSGTHSSRSSGSLSMSADG